MSLSLIAASPVSHVLFESEFTIQSSHVVYFKQLRFEKLYLRGGDRGRDCKWCHVSGVVKFG